MCRSSRRYQQIVLRMSDEPSRFAASAARVLSLDI
jgi:hypothetical protein